MPDEEPRDSSHFARLKKSRATCVVSAAALDSASICGRRAIVGRPEAGSFLSAHAERRAWHHRPPASAACWHEQRKCDPQRQVRFRDVERERRDALLPPCAPCTRIISGWSAERSAPESSAVRSGKRVRGRAKDGDVLESTGG